MKDLKTKSPRRNFLFQILFGWIGLLFLPAIYAVVRYLIPPKLIDTVVRLVSAGKLSQIPLNSSRIVKFNKKPVIVLHASNGEVKAFSAVCTHLGCTVDYDKEAKNFHCYCHDSIYDLNGQNIGGPARLPLTPFHAIVKDDDVSVAPQA